MTVPLKSICYSSKQYCILYLSHGILYPKYQSQTWRSSSRKKKFISPRVGGCWDTFFGVGVDEGALWSNDTKCSHYAGYTTAPFINHMVQVSFSILYTLPFASLWYSDQEGPFSF